MLRLARQVRAHWPFVAAIVIIDLVAIPVALLTPLPLKIAVDSVVGSDPLPRWLAAWVPSGSLSTTGATLVFAAVMVLAVAIVGQAQRVAAWLLQSWTGERIVLDFRAELFRQVQRLSLAYHDARGTADSIFRIQYDAPAIQWIAVYGIAPALRRVDAGAVSPCSARRYWRSNAASWLSRSEYGPACQAREITPL